MSGLSEGSRASVQIKSTSAAFQMLSSTYVRSRLQEREGEIQICRSPSQCARQMQVKSDAIWLVQNRDNSSPQSEKHRNAERFPKRPVASSSRYFTNVRQSISKSEYVKLQYTDDVYLHISWRVPRCQTFAIRIEMSLHQRHIYRVAKTLSMTDLSVFSFSQICVCGEGIVPDACTSISNVESTPFDCFSYLRQFDAS